MVVLSKYYEGKIGLSLLHRAISGGIRGHALSNWGVPALCSLFFLDHFRPRLELKLLNSGFEVHHHRWVCHKPGLEAMF